MITMEERLFFLLCLSLIKLMKLVFMAKKRENFAALNLSRQISLVIVYLGKERINIKFEHGAISFGRVNKMIQRSYDFECKLVVL